MVEKDSPMKVLVLCMVFLLAVPNSGPAQANPNQKIAIDSSGQVISGISLSGDITQGGSCANHQSFGVACIEFMTPNPKVITLSSDRDRIWGIWNPQKSDTESLQLGQIFLSISDGGNKASAKVQSLNNRSLTLEITPLKATESTLSINIGGLISIYIQIIVNKNATPTISLNCPQSITTFEKETLVVKIQSNIPVKWRDYMNYGKTSWGWDRELNAIEVLASADRTFLQLTIRPKLVSNYEEIIRLTASSILNNPYPVEVPDISCEILIKNSSRGRIPSYKVFWQDGSQSSVRQFTADNVNSAYIIIEFAETDSKGNLLQKNDVSRKTRNIQVEVKDSNGQWIRQYERALNADFKVGFDVPAEIFNCHSKCSNRTEKIRFLSEDGILKKEFQITFAPGFFDFSIQVPSQVEWGKKYRVSIRANKSISGTCSFYSYYRGNILQGSSKMTKGFASKFVEFYWGDIKSTTVQLEVVCNSTGFTVSNIAYIRAFRR